MKKLLLIIGLLIASNASAKQLVLTSDNTLVLDDEVTGETTGKVMKKAMEMDSKLPSGEPLNLVLYTPGGSVEDGLQFIEHLNNLNRKVNTVTIFAASMGFHIAQQLNTRYITHFGTYMAHKARGSIAGEMPGQLDSRYLFNLERLNEMDNLVAKRTKGKLTAEQLRVLYTPEHWVNGFNAVKVGFADEEVGVKCDSSLSGTIESSVSFMGFNIGVVKAACPAIIGILEVKALIQTNKGLVEMKDFLSKGGSFSSPATFSWSPFEQGPVAPKEPLYALTPGLDIEKINVIMEKVKKDYNDRKNKGLKDGTTY